MTRDYIIRWVQQNADSDTEMIEIYPDVRGIKYLLKVAVQTLGLVNNDGIKYIIVMSNGNKRERKGTKSYFNVKKLSRVSRRKRIEETQTQVYFSLK